MGAESEEAKDEVNDVVDNLRVRADLSDAPLECPGVAHDAQQMDALQHYRGGAEEHQCGLRAGWVNKPEDDCHDDGPYTRRFG